MKYTEKSSGIGRSGILHTNSSDDCTSLAMSGPRFRLFIGTERETPKGGIECQ